MGRFSVQLTTVFQSGCQLPRISALKRFELRFGWSKPVHRERVLCFDSKRSLPDRLDSLIVVTVPVVLPSHNLARQDEGRALTDFEQDVTSAQVAGVGMATPIGHNRFRAATGSPRLRRN